MKQLKSSGMQQNEFEKQLEKLMGEFRLSPSASVWERVKHGIEKRRRRWPLLALLTGAVIITAGYMIFERRAEKEIKNDTAITRDSLQNAQSQLNPQHSLKLNDSSPIAHDQLLQKDIPTNQNLKTAIENLQVNSSLHLVKNSSPNNFGDSAAFLIQLSESENRKKEVEEKIKITSAMQPADQSKEISTMNSVKTNTVNAEPDTVKSFVSIENKINSSGSLAKEKDATKKTTKHHLSFGITAYAGRSNTVNHLFDQSKNSAASNPFDTIINAAIRPKQPFTPSYMYQLGGTVQKSISKKLSVSAGISYTHFTTKAQTSEINNSPVALAVPGLTGTEFISNYFKPGGSELQVNKYKLIGVSLGLHQKMTNSKKIPVYADAGVSAMRLLSAKTLIYDNYSNAYYHKNDWLQKTQVSMQLGVSMHIKLNSANYLFVGPQVQYGFTNLLKNKNYSPQHLFSYGLQAGWVIGKK